MEFDIVRTVQGRFYAQTPEEIERAFGKNRTWVEGDVIRRWKRRAGRPQPCNCLSRITFAEERHLVYKDLHDELNDIRLKYAGETRSHKKPGVDDLERMYDAIYGNAYRVFSVQTVAFHLLEEVGEMSKALKDCFTYDAVREPYTEELKKRRIAELEEEIADVFSWMNGLLLKIRRVYYEDAQEYFQSLVPKKPAGVEIRLLFTDEIRMSDIVWAKYGRSPEGEDRPTLWCSGCRSCPCACRRIPMIDWAAVGNGNHSPLVDGTGRTSKQVP
jgi:NTP pyrophosphatase (non-canonical NTP hydrolase)